MRANRAVRPKPCLDVGKGGGFVLGIAGRSNGLAIGKSPMAATLDHGVRYVKCNITGVCAIIQGRSTSAAYAAPKIDRASSSPLLPMRQSCRRRNDANKAVFRMESTGSPRSIASELLVFRPTALPAQCFISLYNFLFKSTAQKSLCNLLI